MCANKTQSTSLDVNKPEETTDDLKEIKTMAQQEKNKLVHMLDNPEEATDNNELDSAAVRCIPAVPDKVELTLYKEPTIEKDDYMMISIEETKSGDVAVYRKNICTGPYTDNMSTMTSNITQLSSEEDIF